MLGRLVVKFVFCVLAPIFTLETSGGHNFRAAGRTAIPYRRPGGCCEAETIGVAESGSRGCSSKFSNFQPGAIHMLVSEWWTGEVASGEHVLSTGALGNFPIPLEAMAWLFWRMW